MLGYPDLRDRQDRVEPNYCMPQNSSVGTIDAQTDLINRQDPIKRTKISNKVKVRVLEEWNCFYIERHRVQRRRSRDRCQGPGATATVSERPNRAGGRRWNELPSKPCGRTRCNRTQRDLQSRRKRFALWLNGARYGQDVNRCALLTDSPQDTNHRLSTGNYDWSSIDIHLPWYKTVLQKNKVKNSTQETRSVPSSVWKALNPG